MIFFNELFTIKINQNEIDYKQWDNKTVTLNDFTVEYRIKHKTWQEFVAVKHNYKGKLGERLTQYLKEQIYKQIEDEFKDKIKLKKKHYDIVMIEYDGNQGEMIKLLKQRGKLIAAMKDDTEITNQIKVLKLDQERRPKSAFITFNHTKALNLVNSLNRQKKNKCFECCKKKQKVMKLQEAEIVNNIKWEMRH